MASIAAAAEHSLGPGASARAFGSYGSYGSRETRKWKQAAGEGGRVLTRNAWETTWNKGGLLFRSTLRVYLVVLIGTKYG